jgi:hypothetical protein
MPVYPGALRIVGYSSEGSVQALSSIPMRSLTAASSAAIQHRQIAQNAVSGRLYESPTIRTEW